MRRVPGGRLERRLRRPGVPDPGAVRQRGAADHRRQLGPLVPGRRVPGPEHRLAARARPVLRPLPPRRRQRLGAGAGADMVRARVGAARGIPDGMARPMACGRRLPPGGDGAARVGARRRCVLRGTRPAERWLGWRPGPPAAVTGRIGHARVSGDRGHGRWPLVGSRLAAERPRTRPPPRRGQRPDLHVRGASRADLHPRRARGRPLAVDVDAGGDVRRPPVGRGPGRHVEPRRDRRPEPDAPPVRYPPDADAGGATDGRAGQDPAAHERLPVRRRPPDPPDRARRLLAGPVAVAVPGDDARLPRLRPSVAAPPARASRRRPAACAAGLRTCDAGRTARGRLVRRPTSPAGGSRRTCWREP